MHYVLFHVPRGDVEDFLRGDPVAKKALAEEPHDDRCCTFRYRATNPKCIGEFGFLDREHVSLRTIGTTAIPQTGLFVRLVGRGYDREECSHLEHVEPCGCVTVTRWEHKLFGNENPPEGYHRCITCGNWIGYRGSAYSQKREYACELHGGRRTAAA